MEMTMPYSKHDDVSDMVPALSLCLDQAVDPAQRPLRHFCDVAGDIHLLAMPVSPLAAIALETQLHHLPLHQHCACSSQAL